MNRPTRIKRNRRAVLGVPKGSSVEAFKRRGTVAEGYNMKTTTQGVLILTEPRKGQIDEATKKIFNIK